MKWNIIINTKYVDFFYPILKKSIEISKFIFTSFQNFDGTVNSLGVDEKLKPLAVQVGLDWSPLVLCMEEVATQDAIVAQAKAGNQAGVTGTPTIFVNGRKLPYGQILPVLEKVYQTLQAQ